MEEKHNCQCKNADDDYLKKLELMAKGSYSERTMKTMFISLTVFCCILIISISVIVFYGINRYHHYRMNTEVVEYTEVIEDESDKKNYNAGGSIINNNNSNIDNSIVGADNGSIKK